MEEIDYIASFLGIDAKNSFVLKDIVEIEDKRLFIIFMKNNIKHTSLEYLNSIQKLEQLKKLFEKEKNRDRVAKAQSNAQVLGDKVRVIAVAIKNEWSIKGKNPTIDNIFRKTGDLYFTSFEAKQLKKIGNLKKIINLSDNGKLEDELEKLNIKIIYNRNKLSEQKKQKQIKFEVKRF